MKTLFSIMALTLIGLSSCEKSESNDDCYNPALIKKSTKEGLWMYYEPVCGCDGKTYGNKDQAMYEYGVKNYTMGECPK